MLNLSFLAHLALRASPSSLGALACGVALAALPACSVELGGTGPVATNDSAFPGTTGGGDPRPVPEDPSVGHPHSDAGSSFSDPPDADLPASHGDAGTLPSGCALDGRYAVKVSFDVTWFGTEFVIVPIVEEGAGVLSFAVLMELETTPQGLQAHFKTCAASVPEFVATITREHYQARFDTATWDSTTMPVFHGLFKTSCLEPGCAVTGDPIYALIGSQLPQPTAAWPTTPAAGQWPDHDSDGQPGVAAHMLGASDGSYAYPPVDIFSVRRVRDLMLGMRVTLGLDGMLDSCDELHGSTPQGSIQTRAVGCQAVTRPFPCTASELSFLNDNLPVWTVGKGQFQAKRVAPEADCKDVRRLFPTSAR